MITLRPCIIVVPADNLDEEIIGISSKYVVKEDRAALFPPAFHDDRTVILRYSGLDQVTRTMQISFLSPFKIDNEINRLLFPLTRFSSQTVTLEYNITFILGEGQSKRGGNTWMRGMNLKPDILKARSYFPVFHTSNEQFSHWISRSRTDPVLLLADTAHHREPVFICSSFQMLSAF